MRVCKVIGNVVATAHHKAYDRQKLMVVQPLDASGEPEGAVLLAVDRVQAGVGDRVLIMADGNGVRQLMGKDTGPIQVLIVGIVDVMGEEGAVR
ncbi:MAG: EutN/CcmL family microcompartment protein [Clostridia bacterium]|nr:EutN/CcmL family microcompartment protein [Deltaproteobacteria bacterium]